MKIIRLLLIGLATFFAPGLHAEVLTGPITNAANGHWYFLLSPTTWPSAEAEAVNLGGHLATINDDAENAWVTNAFSNFGGVGRSLWIGLNDSAQEGVWVWVSGDPAPYRNWAPGQPDNWGGYPGQDYVVIVAPGDPMDGMWYDWYDAPYLAYSAVVELVSPIPPTIASQPQSQTVPVGETVVFSVTTTGTPPFTYQWSFNGTNINGATANPLLLTNVQFAEAGNYSVVVANMAGTNTSSDALLTVIPPAPCATPLADLISWWPGSGTATDVVDGNSGVLVGNATFAEGKVGQAFVFDGIGDGVQIDAASNLRLQDFSIETWIRRTSSTVVSFNDNGDGMIYSQGSSGGCRFYLRADGVLHFNGVTAGSQIIDTYWHHVAMTKRSTNVSFYVDGVAYPAPAYDSGGFALSPGYIGGRYIPAMQRMGDSFYGLIDELAIYNRELAATEIQAIYNARSAGKCGGPAPVIFVQPADQTGFENETVTFDVTALGTSPLAYQWQFNGSNILGATSSAFTLFNTQFTNAGNYSVTVTNLYGSETSSNAVLTVNPARPCVPPLPGLISWWRAEGNGLDAVGNNHANLDGNAGFGAGQVGQGLAFDGNYDGVRLGYPASLKLQTFTIEAWIKRASTIRGTQDPYYTHGSLLCYGTYGYSFSLLADGRLNLGKVSVSAVESSSVTVTDTNYHHVAVTKSGSDVVFYVDGVPEGTNYDATFSFPSPVAIGARGTDLAHSFWGSIDEMAVYNRALSTNEIQSIYNARLEGKCIVPVPPTIVSDPPNTNVVPGANLTLSVVAGGSALAYQWRFNGTNIAGAIGSALTLTNVQFSQAGDYSVQVTNIAGSALSSNASLMVHATVRVLNTNAMGGAPVTMPVTLAAAGNENTFRFSLNFNTQRLTFDSVTWGSSVNGATLQLITDEAGLGRLGFSVAFPAGMAFAGGTQEVVRVHFNSLPVWGVLTAYAPIIFGDQPVLRELYDSQLQLLAANYSGCTVTLTPTVLEADVDPRPNGNQAVTSPYGDWVQVGRFASRLDTAAAAGEFQRADCAPRATLGDGQLKVTDWVQTGRYVAGLDPLTAVGGPTNEIAPGAGSSSGSREVRLSNANVFQGQPTSVSVVLEAQGNENALGFTVAFDPTAFTFVSVTPGWGSTGAWNAEASRNTSQVAAGRIGIVLAKAPGSVFSAVTPEMVVVNLVAKPDAVGTFPISFTDQMVTRCVSDALADELPVSYVNGTVTVNPPNPTLDIVLSSNNVVLSWPLWAADFSLQTLGESGGVQRTWTNTPGALQTNGSTVLITLPIAAESKFFRLFRP